MTVQKAIERISFRMQQKKMYQEDVDAINAIIDYVEAQDEAAYMENLLFAKLFLERFMMFAMLGTHSASDCLVEIENILATPMIEIVRQFKANVPFYRFDNLAHKKARIKDPFNFNEVMKEMQRVAKENEKELLKTLKTPYTEEQAIDFVKHQVNRLTKLYNVKSNT